MVHSMLMNRNITYGFVMQESTAEKNHGTHFTDNFSIRIQI